MILFIDNYDSFVYNLVRYVRELHGQTEVFRNDQITLEEIKQLAPKAIILSPGPCGPEESGICLDIVKNLAGHIPILGVCLGHQVIAHSLGGSVRRSKTPMHGKASLIDHDGSGIFEGLPNPLQVGRYHSLSIEAGDQFHVQSISLDGEIMAIKHKDHDIWGVQFHPESVLTENGHGLIKNFLKLAKVL